MLPSTSRLQKKPSSRMMLLPTTLTTPPIEKPVASSPGGRERLACVCAPGVGALSSRWAGYGSANRIYRSNRALSGISKPRLYFSETIARSKSPRCCVAEPGLALLHVGRIDLRAMLRSSGVAVACLRVA